MSNIGEGLNSAIEAFAGTPAATDMLQLAAENSPNMVKAAVMSAMNGDVAAAADAAKDTYAKLDTTRYQAGLVEALNEQGYVTETKRGRLYVVGNEYDQPVAWSAAARL